MAFLQEYLQTAKADAQGNDAGVVGAFKQFPVGRFLFQAVHQAGDHDQARRDVDVENVFPAPVFRQPATERRADRWREGCRHRKHGHAFGAVMFGKFDQGQGEGQRNQRAAREALQCTKDDHAFQAPGHGAEQGGREKSEGHPHRQASRRQQLHEPGGERDHDDLRHQVGGGNPRAFLQGRRQRALDILERGIGDLDVQHRHEGAEHHAHHRDPVPPGRFPDRANQLITGHRQVCLCCSLWW
ncbi:hypothetical protein D3C76_1099210 [compost metagenome]